MKKIFLALALAVSSIAAISCKKNLETGPTDADFIGNIFCETQTRTQLSGYSILWNEEDSISVNGVIYKVVSGAGTETGYFRKDDTGSDPSVPYTAYYPSSIFDGTCATLPSVQTYGTFAMNPMYAVSESKSLQFTNLCGVLAVNVSSRDVASVRYIRVSSSDKALSGAFSVTGGKAVLNNPEDVSATVTLDCGEDGVAPSESGTTFFIGIPAQTYRNLKIEISEDGVTFAKSVTTKADQDITVEEGRVYPIGIDALSVGGYNLFGYVRCGETPLKDVVVTDGYEFTTTAEDGSYRLKSDKQYGFVEITLPSGYRAPSDGVIPLFFARTSPEKYTLERHDFNLIKDADQTRHTMLFFTDMHLGNQTNDIESYKVFQNDVNSYISEHPSENIFASTGGDNSFDKRWYTQNFFPSDYLANADSAFSASGLQIFHCIGNHDHEKGKSGAYPAGEIACSQRYKDDIGPTFYSYNIGQLHYICLDNIYCTNDGTGNTSYQSTLEPYMLLWLKKDLSYVERSTPIVIQMHAPMWSSTGAFSGNTDGNKDSLVNALDGRRTYILSGHAHKLYTTDRLDDLNIIELNSSSVCGTWWVTQKYNPGIRINREGTPAGYRIIKVDGTDVSWQFKAYGRPVTEQLRTYDLNKIDLRWQNYAPNINQSEDTLARYATDVSPYNRSFSNNNVFFVVYDYDPKWKIEVWEEGESRTVIPWEVKDPLHIISYETVVYDKKGLPVSGLMTTKDAKMFRVVCSSATSTVTFRITDRFGKVYEETMTRPKTFSIAEYSE